MILRNSLKKPSFSASFPGINHVKGVSFCSRVASSSSLASKAKPMKNPSTSLQEVHVELAFNICGFDPSSSLAYIVSQ
ncbi:hypothetical protein VNO77_02860 [Canavalia gladiata]|uniref:Uncharacterized protein n=1 Tax=Canavalia gladiata TaxID=3824 RepID=A0AAN9R7M1_CANGL